MQIIITDLKERRQYDGNAIRESGTGGGVTCVIYLSRELVKIGHNVTVCNRRVNTTWVDGVCYTSRDDAANYEYDVWINSRTPHAFMDGDIRAKKKILWLHDLYLKDLEKLWTWCDVIVPVSNWHASWLDRIYHWKNLVCCYPIYNGTDFKKFKDVIPSVKNNSTIYNIWTPISKKGLDVFLEMYPLIRERVKKETGKEIHTDIFGSYHAWGYIDNENRAVSQGLYDVISKGFDGGEYHGSVNQFVLADFYEKADTFIFPSDFKETFCINALDAMASNTALIYHNCGSLPEVVGNNGIMVSGKMRDKGGVLMTFRDNFVNSVINIIKNDKQRKTLTDNAYNHALNFSWDKIAKIWDDLFLQLQRQ